VSSFHVLNFHTAVEDTDTHHGEQIVGSVRVIVDTTKEGGGSIGSDSPLDQVSTSRVILVEARAVVDKAVNSDQRPFFRLGLEVVPAYNR